MKTTLLALVAVFSVMCSPAMAKVKVSDNAIDNAIFFQAYIQKCKGRHDFVRMPRGFPQAIRIILKRGTKTQLDHARGILRRIRGWSSPKEFCRIARDDVLDLLRYVKRQK